MTPVNRQCECTEPCATVFYEPVVSASAISEISVRQILGDRAADLSRKYIMALNNRDKLDKEQYLKDMWILSTVKNNFKSMQQYLIDHLAETKESTITKIKNSIRSFKKLVISSKSVLFYDQSNMLSSFENSFGKEWSFLQSLLKQIKDNLYLLLQYTDVSQIKGLAGNIQSMCQVTLTRLRSYQSSLQNITELQKHDQYLPLRMHVGTNMSAECNGHLSNLTHNLGQVTGHMPFLVWNNTVNASSLPIINIMYSELHRYATLSVTCLDEYHSILVNASNEIESVQELVGELNGYDVNEEFAEVMQYGLQISEMFDEYIHGQVDKYQMTKRVSARYIHNAISDLKAFVRRLSSDNIHHVETRLTVVDDWAVKSCQKLFQQAVVLQMFFHRGHYEERMRHCAILKRPLLGTSLDVDVQGSVDIYNVWPGNLSMSLFVKERAPQVLSEHTGAFMEGVIVVLETMERRVREFERTLVLSLEEIEQRFQEFISESKLGKHFVT